MNPTNDSIRERFEEKISGGKLIAVTDKTLELLQKRGGDVGVEVRDCSASILSFIEESVTLATREVKREIRERIADKRCYSENGVPAKCDHNETIDRILDLHLLSTLDTSEEQK